MTKQQTTEIEALRTFAMAHDEVEFAHLCTAALNGEEWAMTRMLDVIDMCDGFSSAGVLNVIRATDTMRPDGDMRTLDSCSLNSAVSAALGLHDQIDLD